MIIESIKIETSFHDDFCKFLETDSPYDALIKTIDLASKMHPSLIQYREKDNEYLITELKNSAKQLFELTTKFMNKPNLTVESERSLDERRQYRYHLEAYLNKKTLFEFDRSLLGNY